MQDELNPEDLQVFEELEKRSQQTIFKRICKEVEPIENEQNLKPEVPRQKRPEDMTYEEIMLDIFGEI